MTAQACAPVTASRNSLMNAVYSHVIGFFTAIFFFSFSTGLVACERIQPVLQAERLVERDGSLSVHTVTLPDQLTRELRQPNVRIRYRLDVSPCAGIGSIFLYRVGATYRVWLNSDPPNQQSLPTWLPERGTRDDLLASWGTTVRNGRVPATYLIPAAAQKLEVELTGLPYIPSGLIGVELGPNKSTASAQAKAFSFLSTGSDLVAGISLFIGFVAVLLIFGRQSDVGVRWFAFGCIVWGLRNLLYLNSELPGEGQIAELFLSQAVVVSAISMAACALHVSAHAGKRWRRWFAITITVVVAGSGLSIVWPQFGLPMRLFGFLLTVGILSATAWQLFWRPSQIDGVSRNLQSLLGLACAIAVVVGMHDFGIVLGWRPPDSAVLIFWGFSGLVITLGLLSGARVVAALGRAENSTIELEHRVAQKNSELEHSYAALRETELQSERHLARNLERERINREMHDGLGAQLITALRGVERGALSREQITNALQDGVDELRLLMDASDLERNLHASLAAWRSRWDARLGAVGIELHWKLDPALETLDLGGDSNLQIMRIVQEATANTIKHAQATELHVHAQLIEDALQVVVADNGGGLPAETISNGVGRGLRNMRHRADQLHAHLTINSPWCEGRGTSVLLRIPMKPEASTQTSPA